MTRAAFSSLVATDLVPSEVVHAAHRAVSARRNARLRRHDRLKKDVHRLSFDIAGRASSVVVKRLLPDRANAVQETFARWLPAAGLEDACPGLRDVVPEPGGEAVWHVYEDIPGRTLESGGSPRSDIELVVDVIAALHATFTGQVVLGECRSRGGELGMAFFHFEVAESIRQLRSLSSFPSSADVDLVDRLLSRMERLRDEGEERAYLLALSEDPDTLLHGDLWTTNMIISLREESPVARLIDWDHVGVGPSAYDLSTFLLRFPSQHRPWILDCYKDAVSRHGRRPPHQWVLNKTFETAEFTRYACCLAEAATAARGHRWGWERMAEIERWFLDWDPNLLGQLP